MAKAYLVTVHIHMRALSILPFCNAVLAIHGIAQFLAASREKPLPGEVSLHRRIRDSKLIVVIELDPVSVKGDVDKIIVLLIVRQADPDRCDDRRIPQGVVREVHVPHDLLAAQRHALRVKPQLRGNQLVKSLDLAATADDKHRTRGFAAVEFLDRIRCEL